MNTKDFARRLAAGFLLWSAVALGGLQPSSVIAAASANESVPTIAISAGSHHTCAVAADGTVTCWGSNTHGQLGTGEIYKSDVPVVVTGGALAGKTVTEISTGSIHTCALVSDGTVVCWGYNEDGQLGIGNNTDSNLPVAVSGGALVGKSVTQIATGAYHTCALVSDGTVACWGNNSSGGLGVDNDTDSNLPVAVSGGALAGKTVTEISAGYDNTCALVSDGTVACWGDNRWGQLGVGDRLNRDIPVAITGGVLTGTTVSQISVGTMTTCALVSDGTAACWGNNEFGQLGNGGTGSSDLPVAVTPGDIPGKTIAQITAGVHTCALVSDGTVACWGRNDYGQLGNGGTDGGVNSPQLIDGGILAGVTVTYIAAGLFHTCALVSDGTVSCWGNNGSGQLGVGDETSRNVPVAVARNVRADVTATPTVSGIAQWGRTLTAGDGTWTGSPTPALSHQWYKCTANVAAATRTIPGTCSAISGAIGGTLLVSSALAGKYVAVAVTGESSGTSAVTWLSASTKSRVVIRSTNIARPAISGSARVNKVLTAAKGFWVAWPAPSFTYKWYSCTTKVLAATQTIPRTCRAIAGATSSKFRLTAAQSGNYVAVRVTGTSWGTSATHWLSRTTTTKVR